MTCCLLPLVLVAAVTLLMAPAWAQQPAKMPVVSGLVTHAAANDPSFDDFRVALRELGCHEVRKSTIKLHSTAEK